MEATSKDGSEELEDACPKAATETRNVRQPTVAIRVIVCVSPQMTDVAAVVLLTAFGWRLPAAFLVAMTNERRQGLSPNRDGAL
jgi:hypothetical protein